MVILIPIIYIKIIIIKKLIIRPRPQAGRPASPHTPALARGLHRGARAYPSLGARGILQPQAGYYKKIKMFKAGPVSA